MGTSQETERIINGCIKGNRKSQEELYRSYYPAMMNLCLRYTQQSEEALEVLNTGFLKVFQNIQRFDSSRAGLFTWIRTIIVNTCIDHIRARKKEDVWMELDTEADAEIASEAVQRMNAEEILQHIRALPPATSAVFNLYVIDGYNHKEIGELLNISEGTSKWHLSEARKKLKEMIGDKIVQPDKVKVL